MVTRVRIEAESNNIGELEQTLQQAHEALGNVAPGTTRRLMFGGGNEALEDAQAGEFVVERFARDADDGPGHGAILYRGRMVRHYAKPSKVTRLDRHAVTE